MLLCPDLKKEKGIEKGERNREAGRRDSGINAQ